MPTALKAVEDGKRPHPKQLLDHPDARIRGHIGNHGGEAVAVRDALDGSDV